MAAMLIQRMRVLVFIALAVPALGCGSRRDAQPDAATTPREVPPTATPPMTQRAPEPAGIDAFTMFLRSESKQDVKADLIITSPSGARIGYDPRSRAELDEMPDHNGGYDRIANGTKYIQGEASIQLPDSGEYLVQVVGRGADSCQLQILAHHADRPPTEFNEPHIKVTSHAVVSFQLTVDGAEVSLRRLPASR
jgi:hypothetical protein